MLVGAFEVHDGVGAAVDLAVDAGKPWKMLGVFEAEGVRRAGVEPDIEDVRDLLPIVRIVDEAVEEGLATLEKVRIRFYRPGRRGDPA